MAILTYNGRPIDCGSFLPPFSTQSNSWSFLTYGNCVWHDPNGNCCYSYGSTQKKFNGTTWSNLTLNGGVSGVSGSNIWNDGTNIYYSSGNNQYKLTWRSNTWIDFNSKTWSGLTYFDGYLVWSDGTSIYYSGGGEGDQYVLNVSNSTWSSKIWNGLYYIDASMIWNDGTNYYYSYGTTHYVLDIATSTWSAKTWYGLTSFDGWNVWKLGNNIFYSSGSNHYVLDKSTSTWSKIYPGSSFNGYNVWNNDGDTYVNGNYIIVENTPSENNFISYETT